MARNGPDIEVSLPSVPADAFLSTTDDLPYAHIRELTRVAIGSRRRQQLFTTVIATVWTIVAHAFRRLPWHATSSTHAFTGPQSLSSP